LQKGIIFSIRTHYGMSEKKLKSVEFVGSFPRADLCPTDGLPEFAFIGRSNVGKSSLINMLCERKNMAHTSQHPGKTQSLNFYKAEHSWYLVDLPGYGYAKVSKSSREKWQTMIQYYLSKRKELACCFILIDSNIPPQQNDLDFINKLGSWAVPFAIVFTKTDRGKTTEIQSNIAKFNKALLKSWNALPPQFLSSAEKKIGQENILNYIDEVRLAWLASQDNM
jgi:GTP-binding protein